MVRAVINAIVSLFSPEPVPGIEHMKAERLAAQQAFKDALRRRDSRDAHRASNDLIRLTSQLLRVGG